MIFTLIQFVTWIVSLHDKYYSNHVCLSKCNIRSSVVLFLIPRGVTNLYNLATTQLYQRKCSPFLNHFSVNTSVWLRISYQHRYNDKWTVVKVVQYVCLFVSICVSSSRNRIDIQCVSIIILSRLLEIIKMYFTTSSNHESVGTNWTLINSLLIDSVKIRS